MSKRTWTILVIGLVIMFGLFNRRTSTAQVNSKSYSGLLYLLLDHSANEISVEEAAALNDAVWLDAREPNEFDVSHVKDAKSIGYDGFTMESVNELNKEDTIVVYCSVGKRSENICKKLEEAGYQNVYNLYGGIFEWKNQDQPVYKDEKETERVHAYDKTWGVWLEKGEKVFD